MRGVTRNQIEELLGRRIAAWNAHDAAALAAMHAPDGTVASPAGGALEGRDEIARVYRTWISAFPDMITRQETVVIDGNRAVQVVTLAGTHAGEFFGLAATGRHIEFLFASVMTMTDGLIAEERRIYDFTGVLIQVGVLKAKPTA